MIHCLSLLRLPVRSLVVVLSLTVIGCGGDGSPANTKGAKKPRVGAAGKVEYEGKGLEAGTIGFTCKDTGNSATCVITNGVFTCKPEEGPNPGENAVLVVAKEKADGPILWTWSSKVDVPEGGLTAGEFSVKAKATKKPAKPNPDDI
jgi:hypothetical protein